MAENPEYTRYHPKWYRAKMPIFWWVHQWPHLKFILRELTSVPVAFYAVILLFHIRALAAGPEAYADFLTVLQTPISIVCHGISFVFVIFHSMTWFNLAPKALVLRLGKRRVPGLMISASNYFAWLALSAFVIWVLY